MYIYVGHVCKTHVMLHICQCDATKMSLVWSEHVLADGVLCDNHIAYVHILELSGHCINAGVNFFRRALTHF